jgi:hypothetical protein
MRLPLFPALSVGFEAERKIMSPREIRDFYRENVETLRTAFQEILHQHFLLLSAFVPKIVDSIKASLSGYLSEGSEDGEKITSALNTLLVPGIENAVFTRCPGRR